MLLLLHLSLFAGTITSTLTDMSVITSPGTADARSGPSAAGPSARTIGPRAKDPLPLLSLLVRVVLGAFLGSGVAKPAVFASSASAAAEISAWYARALRNVQTLVVGLVLWPLRLLLLLGVPLTPLGWVEHMHGGGE